MIEHDAWFWHGLVYTSCLEIYKESRAWVDVAEMLSDCLDYSGM